MRRSRADSDAVSLFPFLAVLVCTMGSLIVLLFVVARQARLQAASALEPASARRDAKRDAQLAALQGLHDRLHQRLERDRKILRHLESRIRGLRENLESLKQAARDLTQAGASTDQQLARDRKELQRLEILIDEAEADLKRLQEQARTRKPSYAIVPFQGSHHTFRRPVYVECRADRVVLQPEGVVLVRADFEGPLDPGNPLAAAVRAAAEYHAQRQQSIGHASAPTPTTTEAYPLLIVRPGGIIAYYKAREALASWEGQFGYELVGEDWQLKYATADPQLARVEQQAVEQARQRRARLAVAAPSKFGGIHTPARIDGQGLRFQPFGDEKSDGRRPTQAPPSEAVAPKAVAEGAAEARADSAGAVGTKPSNRSGPSGKPPPKAQTIPGGPNPSMAGRDSLADRRGSNWALPQRGRRGVPLRRPVRVIVRRDRLAILSDDGPRGTVAQGHVLSAKAGPEEAVDALVAALKEHIDSWGIAGRGMYWKPVLKLHVTPEGETLARQLEQALHGSGLQTVRDVGGHEPSPHSGH